MVIDSGYGSAIPSCVVAHMNKTGAVAKSGLINVGDHILSINGISLVGMPLKLAVEQIKVREKEAESYLCPILLHYCLLVDIVEFTFLNKFIEFNFCGPYILLPN